MQVVSNQILLKLHFVVGSSILAQTRGRFEFLIKIQNEYYNSIV